MANAHQTSYHAANSSDFIKASKMTQNRLQTDMGATQSNFRSQQTGGLVIADIDEPNERTR